MRRVLVLTWVWLTLFSLPLIADQVTLKNGDRLSGTIVKTDDGARTLLMKADLVGDVTIKWEVITAIVSTQPLHLVLSDGRVIVGTVSTSDGKLEVATNTGAVSTSYEAVKSVRNNAEQAEADRLAHPGLWDYWNGLFDLGLSVTSGNSSTTALTIAGKAARAVPKNKLTLYYTEVYSKDTAVSPTLTTANAIHGGARDDFNLTPKLFVFAFTDFDEDALQHLDLRNVLGGGLGEHLINTKNLQFDVFGGASFDQEYFAAYSVANPTPPPAFLPEPALTHHFAEIVAGESLAMKIGARTTVSEQLTFFPNLSSVGDYRITMDATAATKMKNWLSWQVTFSDRYLSDPPFGLKSNDLLLSTGFRLTFGKGIL